MEREVYITILDKQSMKALVWQGPREMTVEDAPVAAVQADEVMIRVAYCGICGSELSGYLGHNALRIPPLIMGHEFSGEIVALGARAQADNPELEVGAKVTADPMVFDGTCRYCEQGLNHLCANRSLVGAHRPGAFAEYVTIPSRMVFVLPPAMDLRTGALSEPTACGVRIAELAGRVEGSSALIVGAGAIGLLALQVLKHRGAAPVYVSDTNTQRLSQAAELGGVALNPHEVSVVERVAEATGGQGVAFAVDAVGLAVTRAQCISAVERGGKVLLSGLHEETSAMPVADIIRKELTAQGTYCYTPRDFSEAIRLLDQGVVTLGSWVVEAPLSDGQDWFERLVGDLGQVAKVLLTPGT